MKYKKSSLTHIQAKDNLVIFTRKIDTLITLTTFLKKCEKDEDDLYMKMGEYQLVSQSLINENSNFKVM